MPTKTTGAILLIIGILMIAYTGFNYVTTEKVVDLGPIKINADKEHHIAWSPVIGIVLLVGGIVVLTRSSAVRS